MQELGEFIREPCKLAELRQRSGTCLKSKLRQKQPGEATWYVFLQRNTFEGANQALRGELDAMVTMPAVTSEALPSRGADTTVLTELDAMLVKDEGDARPVVVSSDRLENTTSSATGQAATGLFCGGLRTMAPKKATSQRLQD